MKYSLKATCAAYFLRTITRLLFATCRIHIRDQHHFLNAANAGACLISLWHNRLILVGYSLLHVAPTRNYTAFISNSRDGDIASAYAESHSNGRTIRVPHDARKEALRQLVESLKSKETIAIITPDGPRGPRYQVKPGIAVAAHETGASIVPLSWKASNYWELKSWDGFRIPKPFSTIEVVFGEPIYPDPIDSISNLIAKVQRGMDDSDLK